MGNKNFIIFMLFLALGATQAYTIFKKHFDHKDVFEKKISRLENQLLQEEIKRLVVQNQLSELKTDVAVVLPSALKQAPAGEKSYPLRALASVVSKKEMDHLQVRLSKRNFEGAKKLFREQRLSEAKIAFRDFIRLSPYSIHITEAYFLLSEVYFSLREFEDCLSVVENMIQLFPESELTGFAMLRMGKIFEHMDRPEDAVDLYKTVLKTFPQRGIASQAAMSLRAVDL